jgi:hypothetical protein
LTPIDLGFYRRITLAVSANAFESRTYNKTFSNSVTNMSNPANERMTTSAVLANAFESRTYNKTVGNSVKVTNKSNPANEQMTTSAVSANAFESRTYNLLKSKDVLIIVCGLGLQIVWIGLLLVNLGFEFSQNTWVELMTRLNPVFSCCIVIAAIYALKIICDMISEDENTRLHLLNVITLLLYIWCLMDIFSS